MSQEALTSTFERTVPIVFADADSHRWHESKTLRPSQDDTIRPDPSKSMSASSKYVLPPNEDRDHYSLGSVLTQVDAANGRYVLYHGTSLAALLKIIDTGILPVGDGFLGAGFYVSSNPNVCKEYAHLKAESHDVPVIVRLSVAPTKARKLHVTTDPDDDLWDVIQDDEEISQFNFWSRDTIRRLRMDAIYVEGPFDVTVHDRIRAAQRTARHVRAESSKSNSKSKNARSSSS